MPSRLPYTSLEIDRGHVIRRDTILLTSHLEAADARFLPLWKDQHAVDSQNRPVSLDRSAIGARAMVFLGLAEGVPWFAADLSDLAEPPAVADVAWRDLRAFGATASNLHGGLMAYARGLLGWHRRHGFCGVCGAPTEMLEGGHMRLCTNGDCSTPHFPRTDPAVIMLVVDDQDRALLGRQARWTSGMVSTLAGFVEPGETLEQAVAREVEEESAIVVPVEGVEYIASQPWPFPASLMLAFQARAATTDITVDTDELEEARWFTRDEVLTFGETVIDSPEPSPGYTLPRRDSVARFLIERWLRRGE